LDEQLLKDEVPIGATLGHFEVEKSHLFLKAYVVRK